MQSCKLWRFFNSTVLTLTKWVNVVAAVLLVAMMGLTGVDVTARYFFNKPIIGSYEITEYLMVIIISLGLSVCALKKGHVRVDLIISRLSPRARAVMDIIDTILFLGIFVLVVWQSIVYALGMMESHQTTVNLYIPLAPSVLVLTFGSIILCLVLMRDVAEYFSKVVKKWK